MKRKMRSNMIDSSIFLEAYDETPFAGDCKVLIEGAKKKVYFGNVSTIILGEITKKLLKLKKEASENEKYRYEDIYNNLMKDLLNFKIRYICEGTLEKHKELDIRGADKSHDKLNLACAIHNKCNIFVLKDNKFTYHKKGFTEVIHITEKENEKLKNLLNEIKSR